MLEAGHYGSNIIEARLGQLQGQWDDIHTRAEARDKDLEENNLTQVPLPLPSGCIDGGTRPHLTSTHYPSLLFLIEN